MSVLNHLAQAAAIIMLGELLIVLIIFLAISGGLAYGTHWVVGKTDWAFGKVNGYVALGRRYLRTGLDYVALPFIKATGYSVQAGATLRGVRERIRQIQAARQPALPEPPAALPVEREPAEPATADPLTTV